MKLTKLVLPLAIAAVVALRAQGAQQSDKPLFTSESELVVVHVTVKDRRGRYVTGLSKDAFGIVEDGKAQEVTHFTSEDAPVTIGLIVDNSGSMLPNLDRVIASVTAFVQASNPQDELFALAFDNEVHPALTEEAPFTSDVNVLHRALKETLHPVGQTALFDAVSAGLDYLSHGRYERKALVLVSDGGDNASHTTLPEVMRKTQTSDAVIYTVALLDPADRDDNPKLLKRLAAAAGGESFEPDSPKDINAALQHIARDIRHIYTLGYASNNQARNGEFRKLQVSVELPDHHRIIARTRNGYLAGHAK